MQSRIKLSVLLSLASVLILTVTVAAYKRECGDVYRGSGAGVIALTFDDGPDEEMTDEILAILQKYNVKATFFMIGKNVRLYPDVAARVINSGHEVGNHTFSHEYMTNSPIEAIEKEISLANDAIFGAAEYEPHFLRPPGGIYDANVISAAEKRDLIIAMWSVDTHDWCHRGSSEIASEVLSKVTDGDVILMHDYIFGESHTAEALEIIIPELLERGYEFVTLSDMYLNHGQ